LEPGIFPKGGQYTIAVSRNPVTTNPVDDKPGDRQAVHPLLRIRTDNIPSAQMRDRQKRAVLSDHEFDNWIYLDRQLAPGEQYYWYP
jgi:hypothetical protein